MHLSVFLPFRVFLDQAGVTRISARTRLGSFGLLPQRRDCVAALAPGILAFDAEGAGTVYLAIDEGVLVKTGADVQVSVRHASRGTDLGQLHEVVRSDVLARAGFEREVRVAVARMTGGLVARLAELPHGR